MRQAPEARIVAAAFLGLTLIAGGRARADEFPVPKVDFTADSVTRVTGMGAPSTPGAAPGQPMEITGKMYQSGEKSRQEVNMGTMQNVVINRLDKKVVWTIMPMTKSYMEFGADDPKVKKDDMQSFWKTHDAKLVKIGKEEVNGVETTHSKVTIASASPDGRSFEGEVWLTKDNIPMRMKTLPPHGGEVLMELKNVKIGKQDPSLFELPAGYTKMQMPDLSGLAGAAGAVGAAPGGAGQAGAGVKQQMSPEQMKQLQEQLRKQLEQMQKNMPKAPPQAAPATP